MTGNRARILMYHRISAVNSVRATSAALFEQQIAYVASNFSVHRLDDVVARLCAGEPLDPLTVVVTIDDGYRDFLELAYPILKRYRVPATVYVVSDFADGKAWLWFDAVRWLVLKASEGHRRIEVGDASLSVSLSSSAGRMAAWTELAGVCMTMPPQIRTQAIHELENQLGVQLPQRPPSEYAAMSWSELAELDAEWVELGAHGRSHTILASCSADIQHAEIAGCKAAIEQHTGRKAQAFCYPNGMPGDVNSDTVAILRSCGFTSAVMAGGGLTDRCTDPYHLGRLAVPPDLSQFRNKINGVYSLWHSVSGNGQERL